VLRASLKISLSFLAFLLLINRSSTEAASCSKVIKEWGRARQSLLDLPFLNEKVYPWARAHLNDWTKIISQDIPMTSNELKQKESRFSFKDSSNTPVLIRVFLFRKPENMDLFLIIVPYRESGPLVFFARRITRLRGKIIAEGQGVYLSSEGVPTPNLSRALMEFARSEIYLDLRVTAEVIKADYVGRYHWAKEGFDFMGKAKASYKYNGKWPSKSTLEIVQYNFRNFLKRNSLTLRDLNLPPSKSRISDFTEAKDFARVSAIMAK